MPSYSHYTLAHRLAEGLAEKGHQVTMIAPYKQEKTAGNYKQLYIENLAKIVQEKKTVFFDMESMWPIQQIHLCYQLGYVISEYVLTYQPILDLVKTKKGHFDVVIMDQFYDESLTGIAYKLDAPLIYFSTLVSSIWVNHLVANPAPVSHVPNIFFDYSGRMDFTDRLHNWFLMVAEEAYRHFISFPYHNELLHKAFPDAPHVYDLLYKRDGFILVNSHVSINDPVPHVPNMIEIGGFHVKAGELPKDMKKIIDEAKNGVVFFGMGSNLKVSLLPEEKKKAILRALGRINQTVFWKWEEDTIEGKPDNVILGKWFPQQAILAHPNTKAFISHGGLLSTIEAVSLGKPILGIPIYADQKMNINLAVSRGYALTVPYKQLNEENLFQALDQLINNSSYTETVKWRSAMMHDRLVHPLKEAIYWVEHVIKHKGAHHFRSKAMDLKWYEYEMIDVALLLVVVTLATCAAILYACKSLLGSPSHVSHANGIKKRQ